jgi:2-keto-4-pentenoate hydratase
MSNGAFVKGEDLRYPETRDLSQLEVALTVGGNVLVTKKGGHPAGDPFGPVVTLVNFVRAKGGVKAGQFVTTGSFTGMTRVGVAELVSGQFDSSETVILEFVA